MKKIIIHIEEIKKRGAKLQFQIKLPSTTKMVTGVLITVNPTSKKGKGKKGEVPPDKFPREPERGWLWLRIPENRDVFYADTVRYSNHQNKDFHSIAQQGLAEQPDWWFSGTKREFFKVTIPIEDTMIAGFYVDRSTERDVNYQLKIYLELEIEENQKC